MEGPLLNGDTNVGSENRIIANVDIIAEKGASSVPRLLISATSTVTIKSTSTARASKSTEHHELIGEANPHISKPNLSHVHLLPPVYDIENRKVERLVNNCYFQRFMYYSHYVDNWRTTQPYSAVRPNAVTQRIEKQNWITHWLCHKGNLFYYHHTMLLTSNGNYARQPPQLWSISLGKSLEFTPQYSYRYVTRTKPPKECFNDYWWRDSPRGISFFYGPGDNLVVCWDYNSAFAILQSATH